MGARGSHPAASGGGGGGSGGGGGGGGRDDIPFPVVPAPVPPSLAAAGSWDAPTPTPAPAASFRLPADALVWERDRGGDKVVLGRSATGGAVYAGILRGTPVAIAEEDVEGGDDEEGWLKAAQLRVAATCPHIARVHGAVILHDAGTGKAEHYLVMERLAGSMSALVLQRDAVHAGADVRTRLLWLCDVARALAYLHAGGVIHADVTPDAVMLTAPCVRAPVPAAKLASFGACEQRRRVESKRGSSAFRYTDPEVLDGSASCPTAAADVYSFGVAAWQVLTGDVPYAAELPAEDPCAAAAAPANSAEAVKALTAAVCGAAGRRPPVAALVERGVPPEVVELVVACWAPAAATRPTMAALQRAFEAATAGAAGAAGGAGRGADTTPASASAPPHGAIEYAGSDSVVLGGRNGEVASLAVLPGGRLAAGIRDSVRVWDVARGGDAVTVLGGHGGSVCGLVALPGGARLAAGVRNGVGSIVLWDAGVVPPARGVTVDAGSGVWALAALPDGRLAAGCADGKVRLVGVAPRARVTVLAGHASVVTSLAALPGGRLASGSADQSVRVWEVAHGTCVATLAGHTGTVRALVALSDGRLASGSNDHAVRVWDVGTATCTAVLEGHTNAVYALAALPDGRVASGSADTTIRVWDVGAATAVATLAGHTDYVSALAALPDGRLASGAWDGTVRLWVLPAASLPAI